MIEIVKYHPFSGGVCQGIADVRVQNWGGVVIRGVSHFKKGQDEWISFPCKMYEKSGKKCYMSYIVFPDNTSASEFNKKILNAIVKWKSERGSSKPITVDKKLPSSMDEMFFY